MKAVRAEYAGKKIKEYLEEFNEYADSPVGRVRQLHEPVLREAVRIMRKIERSEGVQEAYKGGGSREQLEELYAKCVKILAVYRIDGIVPEGMDTIRIELEQSDVLAELMAQVKKFGDERLSERLAAIEEGEGEILFEEMEEGTEGYTKYEDGQVRYYLNKKYERIDDEEDLQKASIVLAHELQRNPATGDLKGETSDIVLRDVGYIERLAAEYGNKVYEKMPEFAVLREVKEVFGVSGAKEFVEMAFDHEGSYWRENKDRELLIIELKFMMLIVGARLKGYHMAADNLLHFLKGSGGRRYLDASYLQSFKSVQEAMVINYERYRVYFGEKARNMATDQIIRLKNYPEEGHKAFGTFGDMGYAAKQSAKGSELDLHYASGTYTISTFCDVAIAKDDDGKFYATGNMLHIFWDIYDWHHGLGATVPVLGRIPDEYGDALEQAGRAANFEMQSSWTVYGIDLELQV